MRTKIISNCLTLPPPRFIGIPPEVLEPQLVGSDPLNTCLILSPTPPPPRFIDIPPEVLEIYRLWRPSPLFRARRLEKLLKTPARIYYK